MLFQIDKPVPPGQVGSALFLSNLTDAMRQEFRDQLFAVDRPALVDVANRYLYPVSCPFFRKNIGFKLTCTCSSPLKPIYLSFLSIQSSTDFLIMMKFYRTFVTECCI